MRTSATEPPGAEQSSIVVNAHRINHGEMPVLPDRGEELVRGNTTWRVGDKVMQTRNNYDKDIFNGDLGRIVEINSRTSHVGVKFNHRTVSMEYRDLNELTHAYAITVHKSQGSEYRGVVIPVLTQHYVMLQRNLLYTAVTRATDLVILVGSHKAIALAVQNDQAQRRYSRLDVRL